MEAMPADAAACEQPRRRRALPVLTKAASPESQVERQLFARNLRVARIAANLSQRELAELTGVAQAHISQIENAMHNVALDTMVKFARELDKPLFEFFSL